MTETNEVLIRKLKEHSRLSGADVAAINALSFSTRALGSNQDLVRQGDQPGVSAVVLSGMVARYHLLPNGGFQYGRRHARLAGTFHR